MVVADTSPLNYLVLIGSIDVLPELYERVLVPFEVIEELSAADAPAEVAVWVRSRPAWLEVQVVPWRRAMIDGTRLGRAGSDSPGADGC